MRTADGVLFKGQTMANLAASFENKPDIQAPVVDKTGLVGRFDFFFPYLNVSQGAAATGPPPDVRPDVARRFEAAYSSTFDAVRSVGLEFQPGKRTTTALVIDQIHRPTGN